MNITSNDMTNYYLVLHAAVMQLSTIQTIARLFIRYSWRAVKDFVKKQSAIFFAALEERFVYKLYKPVSSYRKTAIIPTNLVGRSSLNLYIKMFSFCYEEDNLFRQKRLSSNRLSSRESPQGIIFICNHWQPLT